MIRRINSRGRCVKPPEPCMSSSGLAVCLYVVAVRLLACHKYERTRLYHGLGSKSSRVAIDKAVKLEKSSRRNAQTLAILWLKPP